MANQPAKARNKTLGVAQTLSWVAILAFSFLALFSAFTGIVKITVVSGESMLPTYEDGDMILSLKQFDGSYKIGDVIVYHPDDLECDRCNIIHRIVDGNEEDGWITQGDNNDFLDVWTPKSDEIIGKTVYVAPLGDLTEDILNPKMWLMIASFLTFLLIFSLFLNTMEDSKNEKLKEQEESKINDIVEDDPNINESKK